MADGSELLCPRCKVPLKEVRTSGGVFYGCDVCGGRAVTIELLRKRFTPESINPLWLHAMRGEGRVGLPCPSCQQPMIGVALSDQAEINIDVCQHCHFIWFDAHEVDTLVPRQPEPVAPELPQKAREMLAIAEVERLSKQAEGPDLDSAAPEESWKQIAAFLGMPVEFDAPEEQRRPWTTWLLSAAIICASLLAFPHLREVVQRFGLIPVEATRLGGLTFVTSFFLHAGIIHLAGNMYFLLAFGHAVENFLRPLRYLALIALAAFIGDLAHIALDPRSQIPCIGASGGIAGVITFYALDFSADATRFSDALGIRLVSLDSIACLVRFRSLDFVPNHRHSRAESRNEFRLIGRAFRRRGSRRRRVGHVAKNQQRISNTR
jgi:membrane associated rhomboid family serine protease/Zn-finger nucleic acid-binding protein